MKRRNKTKSFYRAPQSVPTEVLFEESLLGASARVLLQIDELENINARSGVEESGDMYFEF